MQLSEVLWISVDCLSDLWLLVLEINKFAVVFINLTLCLEDD